MCSSVRNWNLCAYFMIDPLLCCMYLTIIQNVIWKVIVHGFWNTVCIAVVVYNMNFTHSHKEIRIKTKIRTNYFIGRTHDLWKYPHKVSDAAYDLYKREMCIKTKIWNTWSVKKGANNSHEALEGSVWSGGSTRSCQLLSWVGFPS